ncbi:MULTISPECIES: hypothetical protein [Thermoactinomyces]|jgi:hypothetical protein|uniref:hypothetical protein n=1 Tax=Thermoactinomyces TaxID=2023 RepID=UPI0011076857|nr:MULTISPECIES: hypothetical protein [Thermoactinomyces]MBH8585466.1 hypothetical protein [Thermoactinomyces sp. CICC 10520]MBI0390503.1 hypothetical protein [Thermoactinomyces sp. CICC 24226]QCV56148.1 hypothetical protein FA954_11310 [Thermoactinomyces vulgaris]
MIELAGIPLNQDHGITAAQARRIFVLRRGERRIVRCGRRVVRIRRFFLRPGEVLVVICGRGRHRQTFIFVCRGRRIRRTIVRRVRRNTLISVRCV